MAKTKTAKAARKPKKNPYGMIDFSFGDTKYQIDTNRRKVYYRFIEVETSKTSLIMGAFNMALAQAK
ncbi:MAG TPA: hypothetical protein VFQ07_14055 [Candidatus Polarisedimenticolia bacterium]|nr:hypothetical protein [Candidatus Polarisedimenticolia bacterium]